jgi:hypothetical protein
VVDRTSLDAEFNKPSSDFRAILLAMANRFEKMVNLDYQERMAFVATLGP